MTNDTEQSSEFLFVPIISAVLLLLVVVALVWVSQVRPTVQAASNTELIVSEAEGEPAGEQQTTTETTQVSAGNPEMGQQNFASTCAACHGPNAEGIQGLGKPLVNNQFIENRSDEELIEFIKQGRGPDDPANTTGIAMPPKGGNPSLTDDDLQNIVAHLRTLQ